MYSDTARELGLLVLTALVAYYALSPKLLFEAFNGDGAHAFESSRLLLRHALPFFWPDSAGPVAGFPGVTSMLFAFPNAWFLRLFGEVEFAARIPFLLYLPVVGAGVLTLARSGQRGRPAGFHHRLRRGDEPCLLCSRDGVQCHVQPYSANVGLPATQDTLLMIAWLGAAIASLRREYGWLAWFVAMTFMSLPSGVIMIGFLLLARLFVERPRPWQNVFLTGTLLLACLVIAALLPRVLIALGAATPGGEYGAAGILRYFAFLQFTDLSRLLYVVLPAGIFPWLVLLAWKAQDSVGRALTLVTIAYFAFFFVQAQVSLHHFVPAMIVPMVIAARMADRQPLLGMAWLALALVALVLVLPERATIHVAGREVGGTIVEQVGDYRSSDPAVLRASTLLDRVFPYDWDPAVPAQSSVDRRSSGTTTRAIRAASMRRQTTYCSLPETRFPPAGARWPGRAEGLRSWSGARRCSTDNWRSDRRPPRAADGWPSRAAPCFAPWPGMKGIAASAPWTSSNAWAWT